MAERTVAKGEGKAEASGVEAQPGGRSGPNYYLVWLYLLILTIAEVGVAFVSGLPETWLILILLALAVWKAALVAMYYMHLRFEPPRLVMMILAALPLAIMMALVVVTMEGF